MQQLEKDAKVNCTQLLGHHCKRHVKEEVMVGRGRGEGPSLYASKLQG
jgi:hypothetical protein